MLTEFPGAGETFFAGGADVPLAAVAARAALGLGGGAGRRGARRGALALSGPTWQGGNSSSGLDCAKALLDAAAGPRSAEGDVLQLGGQLGGRRRYEYLLRGGRAFPARLLRTFGAALLFSRVRWRTGHLALIFNALTLERFSFSTRGGPGGSGLAGARRDGRKHFCHIDGLEALFRIRVTCFSRNFWGSNSFFTGYCFALVSLSFYSIGKSGERMKNDE